MPASAIMRHLHEASALPADAPVSRRGDIRLRKRDLEFTAWPEVAPDGLVGAAVNIADARLGPAMDEYGRLSVRLRSTGDGLPWPAGRALSEDQAATLGAWFRAARNFVADRRDLADLLAAEAALRRGDLYVWQTKASRPARLVQALILAQDMGDDDLADDLRERLRRGADVRQPGGPDELQQARQWAKRYAKALRREIVF
jgi:hypothetical protein